MAGFRRAGHILEVQTINHFLFMDMCMSNNRSRYAGMILYCSISMCQIINTIDIHHYFLIKYDHYRHIQSCMQHKNIHVVYLLSSSKRDLQYTLCFDSEKVLPSLN